MMPLTKVIIAILALYSVTGTHGFEGVAPYGGVGVAPCKRMKYSSLRWLPW